MVSKMIRDPDKVGFSGKKMGDNFSSFSIKADVVTPDLDETVLMMGLNICSNRVV